MKLGVIVGRFQVPELHEGHKALIEKVQSEHDQVLVLLGVSPVLGSKRHPLDYITRERMVKEAFPDVSVAPLSDQPSDQIWSQTVDAITALACPIGKVTLYGGRDSFIPHYHGKHKTIEVELGFSPSGTDVRYVTSNKIRVSSDFRRGVIYATGNQYSRVFPTVDIAVVRDGKLLLGRKKNQDLFCFPGGFVDPADKSYEHAAHREAFEETSIQCTTLQYVSSHTSRDWRYRHPDDGKIMTTLFVCLDGTGVAVAGDDLDVVEWFDLKALTTDRLVETHHPLLLSLKEKLGMLPFIRGEMTHG